MTPLVSVVIPTYNRLPRLQRVLGALDAQTCAPEKFEVVVVSDGSTDGTHEYLAGATHPYAFRYCTQENAGPASARNLGVQMAVAPLVLFIDDDVVATASLIDEHLASHDRAGGDAVVIGPMNSPPDFEMRPWVAWEQRMLYKQYDAMNAGVFAATFRQFYTGNASLARARLIEVGGFDTRFRRAEDVELSYRLDRAGMHFVWNPAAIGHHYADRSFEAWLRTAYDYGVNEVVFGRAQGQDPAFIRVRAEFRRRNPIVRWMARTCISVPASQRLLDAPLRHLALGRPGRRWPMLSRFAFSGLYNLAYYRGLADELGGAGEFRRVIVRRRLRPAA
jgi:GT2 family glycosyltransferase